LSYNITHSVIIQNQVSEHTEGTKAEENDAINAQGKIRGQNSVHLITFDAIGCKAIPWLFDLEKTVSGYGTLKLK
jgi:hypothetical protein